MLVIVKAVLLFSAIVFIVPLLFFLLIGIFGRYFELTIDNNSRFAKTEVKWIRGLLRFLRFH